MMGNAPEIVLIGGGGHARVLIDALRASNDVRRLAILESEKSRVGESIYDSPVIGTDDILPELVKSGTRSFVVAVGGTRDNAPRARIYERALDLGMKPAAVIHPSAVVSPFASLGAGCQVLAGAIVNANARLGVNVIVNTGAIIEHDCIVGDHAHVATGARLASGVAVGALAHIGAGAVVRQLTKIGTSAVVGAGAVVIKDVSPSVVVIGNPAKERLL